jgi:hypothetical protein
MLGTKTWIGIFGVMLIAVLLIAFKPGDGDTQEQHQTDFEGESFAVVELFTSEGCSSCPPADKVLGDIVKKARNGDQRIFALAFHVDYWNRLGWKDPYSSSEYSQRQRRYARALGSSVYTPQMVVNGKVEFVGSNSRSARSSIENSLDSPAAASVTLRDINTTSDQVNLGYDVAGEYANNVLNVALVERGIVTRVNRGENSGRTLRHENVVRTFRSIDLINNSGKATLELPNDIDMSNASVIAYVQNPQSKEIYGAQAKDLEKKLSSKAN